MGGRAIPGRAFSKPEVFTDFLAQLLEYDH